MSEIFYDYKTKEWYHQLGTYNREWNSKRNRYEFKYHREYTDAPESRWVRFKAKLKTFWPAHWRKVLFIAVITLVPTLTLLAIFWTPWVLLWVALGIVALYVIGIVVALLCTFALWAFEKRD